MKIYVEGVDPSLSNTGLAICEVDTETGQITDVPYLYLAATKTGGGGKTVRKSSDDLRRAREIVQAERQARAEYKPTLVCGEVPSGTQSARGSISNGVCIGFLGSIPLSMIEVSPTEVKLATAGTKTADKEDIVRWAVGKFPDANWILSKRANEWDFKLRGLYVSKDNEHLADAIGAVAAAIKTEQFKGMMSLLTAALN